MERPVPGNDAEPRFRAELNAMLAAVAGPATGQRRVRLLGAGEPDESIPRGRAVLAALAQHGLSTPDLSPDLGGAGLSGWQCAILAETLSGLDIPDLYPFLVGLNLVSRVLAAHGTPRQQARWLPGIQTGEEIWCQLFSEPGAGSDLAALSARARPDGDDWLVSGQKTWTSRAHYAARGLLLARTNADVPKHEGITAFGLDMSTPGITLRPIRQMNGDEHFCEVFLDDVRVPDTDRIGPADGGWQVARATLSAERGTFTERALEVTPDQVVELYRAVDRRDNPALRALAVEAWSQLTLTALVARRVQAARLSGQTPGPEGSGGKLRAVSAYRAVAAFAAQALGPDVMFEGEEWVTTIMTVPSMSIRGGTDEIQRNIIAERVLGLPRDNAKDLDVRR